MMASRRSAKSAVTTRRSPNSRVGEAVRTKRFIPCVPSQARGTMGGSWLVEVACSESLRVAGDENDVGRNSSCKRPSRLPGWRQTGSWPAGDEPARFISSGKGLSGSPERSLPSMWPTESAVETSQRPGKGSRRCALNQNYIGDSRPVWGQGCQQPRANLGRRLSWLHDAQVVVQTDTESE